MTIREEVKNIKEVSLALLSTSALLLTILAVVHVPSSVTDVTASGLYSAIILGVSVLVLVVVFASGEDPAESRRIDRWLGRLMWFFFIVQVISFLVGLGGIYVTILTIAH